MSKKLLYADDDKANRVFVQYAVKEKNIELLLAVDGDRAFDLFEDEKPDVVVTDLYMPNCNGIQLLQKIRKINKEIPVIAFTGADFDDDDDDIESLGFDEIIHKPIGNDEFVEIVEKYLNK